MTGKRLAAVGIAVVAALVGWFVIENVIGTDLIGPSMGGRPTIEIGALAVAISTIVATLIGWGGLALVERRGGGNPRRAWTTLAVIGTVLSLGAPLSGSGLEGSQRGGLMALHLLVAAVFIPIFARTARASTTP